MEQIMSDKMNKLVKEVPINFGPLHNATTNYRLTGPCGDTMEVWMMIKDERIFVATYTTDGCEHSLMCGSSASALATGMPLEKFNALTTEDILKNATIDIPEDSNHCALLALDTMRGAVDKYLKTLEPKAGCTNPGSTCGSCSSSDCNSRQAPKAESTETETMTPEMPAPEKKDPDAILKHRVSLIKHKVAVLSGKGGVGKSTVAVNLAVSLAIEGLKVGLLDVDIHGPSIPTMLGLTTTSVYSNGMALEPASIGNLKIMSIGFLLGDQDAAVIWRGPMKMNVIKQFIGEVEWGELDYLIVDCPPGTGDEPLSVIQILENPDGAVVVTTPQEVSSADVRKSVSFCKQLNLPIIGLVENMSGFICPECHKRTDIFSKGAGEDLSQKYKIPLLGKIPIDPSIGTAGDEGVPFIRKYSESPAAAEFRKIIVPVMEACGEYGESKKKLSDTKNNIINKEKSIMKIAVPIAQGKLSLHFGHCEKFVILDIDETAKTIEKITTFDAPPHEPGALPKWLGEKNVNLIISGGMGSRAQNLFTQQNINVLVGAPSDTPENIVKMYMSGKLEFGSNICDH